DREHGDTGLHDARLGDAADIHARQLLGDGFGQLGGMATADIDNSSVSIGEGQLDGAVTAGKAGAIAIGLSGTAAGALSARGDEDYFLEDVVKVLEVGNAAGRLLVEVQFGNLH